VSDSGDIKPYRILYIEDDQADRIAFEYEAIRTGYSFTFDMADSFSQALVNLEKTNYQAVVSDCNLGDGWATDLFPYLRNSPIFITGGGWGRITVMPKVLDYLIGIWAELFKILHNGRQAIEHKTSIMNWNGTAQAGTAWKNGPMN
jgi:hypothetical protein